MTEAKGGAADECACLLSDRLEARQRADVEKVQTSKLELSKGLGPCASHPAPLAPSSMKSHAYGTAQRNAGQRYPTSKALKAHEVHEKEGAKHLDQLSGSASQLTKQPALTSASTPSFLFAPVSYNNDHHHFPPCLSGTQASTIVLSLHSPQRPALSTLR